MRLDRFTKCVLTVIAGCLVYLSLATLAQPMHAQSIPRDPDFQLLVTAPAGETVVECIRGCELVWVQRGVNPNATPMKTFTYGCGGPNVPQVQTCGSGLIGGYFKGVF